MNSNNQSLNTGKIDNSFEDHQFGNNTEDLNDIQIEMDTASNSQPQELDLPDPRKRSKKQ